MTDHRGAWDMFAGQIGADEPALAHPGRTGTPAQGAVPLIPSR